MKGLDYGGATMEEGNHLFFFGDFFSDCWPSWKSTQMSTFTKNLRLLSIGFEI